MENPLTTTTLNTVLLSLLVPTVMAGAKFLADVRARLNSFQQLLLGYEGKGGGLIDEVKAAANSRGKLDQDVNAAFDRIRSLETATGHVPETRERDHQ